MVILLLSIRCLVLLLLLEFCVCFMFWCAMLCALSGFVVVLIVKKALVALFCLSSWCFVAVMFCCASCGAMVGLHCVIVAFPDQTIFFIRKRHLEVI